MKFTRLVVAALALALGTSTLLMAQNGPPEGYPQQGYGQDHPDHDRGGWDAPPQEFREIQRQGFHDGIEAARNDFQNQRPPNAEWRNEFRHPPVPGPAREEYRDGFRRGYDMAFSHFREGTGPSPMPMNQDYPDHDRGGWDAPPQEFREIQRQGFHDGIEAARNDFQNQRPPNAEWRDEFRHPPVPGPARDEYRDGFRRGYDMAFSHFREDHDRH
jgi:hypothetical protein